MDAAVNQVNIEQSQITADIADTFRSHRQVIRNTSSYFVMSSLVICVAMLLLQILDGVCEEPTTLEMLGRTVTQLNEVESEYSRVHIQKSDEMTALRSQVTREHFYLQRCSS